MRSIPEGILIFDCDYSKINFFNCSSAKLLLKTSNDERNINIDNKDEQNISSSYCDIKKEEVYF